VFRGVPEHFVKPPGRFFFVLAGCTSAIRRSTCFYLVFMKYFFLAIRVLRLAAFLRTIRRAVRLLRLHVTLELREAGNHLRWIGILNLRGASKKKINNV